jgi:threonine dehydratase
VTARLRLPRIEDIEAAAKRLESVVVHTPLLESAALNKQLGGRLLVKAECLQRTGSFKLRGAYNRIAQLTAAERKRGVVAFSSGNHAQGVASAAAELKVRATIVMPRDAPAVKIANTRGFGAKVVLYDRFTESRETIAAEIADSQGSVVVPPFEDFHVVAGQGTCGLEIAAQAEAMGAKLDTVVAPASGGGLVAGIGVALADRSPRTKIVAAEPQGFDDLARSLKSGKRVENKPGKASICDALMSPSPGQIAFAILKSLKARSVAISDAEAMAAMATAFSAFHIVVEPGGAAALAAVLTGRVAIEGKCVAVVCAGGNADPALFARALTA